MLFRSSPAGSQGTVKQSEQDSAPVRVYATRQREEVETSDVVAGTFSTFNQDVFVLFDPSSTHSYVSASIIDCIGVPCTKMDFEVLVTSPLGQEVREINFDALVISPLG